MSHHVCQLQQPAFVFDALCFTGFTGMVRELFQEGRSQTLHGHAFFQDIGRSDPSMESWAHTVDG